MCGGGGPTGISFVDDAIDKADNWTEAAGEQLAAIDPGPAIGDLGETIDKSVLQPMSKDPVGSVAMIAAAVYAPYLVPYIAAANTAIHGGKLEDIALSFGTAYVAGNIAPGVSEAMGGTASGVSGAAGRVASGAIIGAGAGGATAAIRGQDFGQGALTGGIVGGVTAGVGEAVNAGKIALQGPAPTIAAGTQAGEFGINPNKVGTGEFGINATPGQTEFGVTAPTSAAATPLMADYTNLPATELGLYSPGKTSYGIDPNKVGTGEFGIDPYKTGTGGGIDPGTVDSNALPTQYVAGSSINPLEDQLKKTASKLISGSILEDIYGLGTTSMSYLTGRRRGFGGEDELLNFGASADSNLAPIAQDKFELRKYANDAGASTLISFKDNKPQQPIPDGYREVETIGAAEGGLISTNMVKYSKKPLVAKRKPDVTKEKKTTRKGLASKQS